MDAVSFFEKGQNTKTRTCIGLIISIASRRNLQYSTYAYYLIILTLKVSSMPCSDSSSSISLKLDPEEKFRSFDYAKITCGREITAHTGFAKYLKGKSLPEILTISFRQVQTDLAEILKDDETKFILYLEWDALRAAIAQYLGIEDEHIDKERCMITSIEETEEGTEIAQVILPPKELPKISACSSNLN